MKKDYYKYISEQGITDILSDITEIPYSNKLKSIKVLYDFAGKEITNKTLHFYKENYVDLDRVQLNVMHMILINIAKRYMKEKDREIYA